MFGFGVFAKKRKKYNGTVDTKLNNEYQIATRENPSFPGALAYLGLIDNAWAAKMTEDEAALYVATVYYSGIIKQGYYSEAAALLSRIQSIVSFGLPKGMISEAWWSKFSAEIQQANSSVQATTTKSDETRQNSELEPGQGSFAYASRKCELSIQRYVRLSPEELSKHGLNQDQARIYNDVEDLGQKLIANVLDFWSGKVPSIFTWTDDSIVSPMLRLADGGCLFGEEAIHGMIAEYIDKDFGDISDLPPEVLEAIRLLLYKYFSLLKEPSGIPVTVHMKNSLLEFIKERSELGALTEAVIASVKGLRKIDRASWLYQYSVDFILERSGYNPKSVAVRNSVYTALDAVIQSHGFKLLDQPISYLGLDKEFRVNWTNQKIGRGADFLAAVRITGLSEFDMLRIYFLPDTDSAFLTWKASQKESVNRETFGHMMQVAIDVLAIAVVREFKAQSPELRQLPSA